MDEAVLFEKLRKIEALHAGATTDGERAAAGLARERIMERLAALERVEVPVEYRFSLHDMWRLRLFVALARRYGLQPFRYRRQRRTTVMLKVVPSFLDTILWPEYEAISAELHRFLEDATMRVIASVLHGDASDIDDVEGGSSLPE